MKVKFIQRLMYGKFPYSVQIKPDALKFKNIRWANRGNTLRAVDAFMYNLDDKELSSNRAYFGSYRDHMTSQADAHQAFQVWDKFVIWFNTYVKAHPDCVGRKRHEGNGITFFSKDEKFCNDLVNSFPELCVVYQKVSDPALLPVMEKAAQEKTWLLQREYVDHFPYNEYRYRLYISYEGRDGVANMVELFKSYRDADLVKLNGGFDPLLAGTGRLRYPAHILIKNEDTLELIKLALGPNAISQIVEYVLVDDVLQTSSP